MKENENIWSIKTVVVNVKEGTTLTSLVSELESLNIENCDLVVSCNTSFSFGDKTNSEVNGKYEVGYEEK